MLSDLLRRAIRRIAAIIPALTLLAAYGCHDGGIIDERNTATGNFNTLCQIIDTRYCFLDKQGVDWDSVCAAYRPYVADGMSSRQLYLVLGRMLNELHDGHVNLSSPFGVSYYTDWWADYPADFDERVITLGYLARDYEQMGNITYGFIRGTGIGYIRISSFSGGIPGAGNIDIVLNRFALSPGLIVDVRDNGGGELTAAQEMAERFIDRPTVGAYLCHKTGPGHNDFTEPRPMTFTPPAGHILWTERPVMLLTNRSTFSAANFFAAFMRTLPNVTQVGATTGGGGGIPFSSSLPCGWTVRFSACPVLDPRGELTEDGVAPDEPNRVSFSLDASAEGRDPILDHALRLLGQ